MISFVLSTSFSGLRVDSLGADGVVVLVPLERGQLLKRIDSFFVHGSCLRSPHGGQPKRPHQRSNHLECLSNKFSLKYFLLIKYRGKDVWRVSQYGYMFVQFMHEITLNNN